MTYAFRETIGSIGARKWPNNAVQRLYKNNTIQIRRFQSQSIDSEMLPLPNPILNLLRIDSMEKKMH